ncbi:MarR family winged helix-turn-helix transcriptional regulator [Erythrobacter sp. SN021]|uniref:MarR family winged helix-turn-helix transcriptional regulator n=1 Tax=Erythrobacter TaxID=1041 RepID=UPI001F3A2F7E|nr:MarR family winged helix-turn-helix transcriptional regulator [Erythrobacter sp. SN021]MCF8883281.1 MarR family winged helix-turn-helix transcriptional regulator [Erythrobacter sp. SN021]
MSFEKNGSMGFVTNRLARLFAQHLHARIAPLGLAPAQFMTLLELWEGDGLTQAELTDRLDVEQATMANTLSRMKRDGLIERTPHPHDRRAQLVWLTDKARALEQSAKQAAHSVNQLALAGLEGVDAAEVLGHMNAMIESLREEPG